MPPTGRIWRGPEHNGVSRDKDLPAEWSPDPKAPNSNLVWSAPYGGITTPIVQNGQLYFIDRSGEKLTEQERVVCLDADTGKLKWEYKFNVLHTDIVTDRLGWTTMVGDPETGNVYAHGVQGLLFCFDKNGKVLWEHSLTEEYGRISGYGGRTTSPIVDGDLLILGMLNSSWGYQGMGRTRFVAFNKKTGSVVWWGSGGYPPHEHLLFDSGSRGDRRRAAARQRRRRRLRTRLQGSHRRKGLELSTSARKTSTVRRWCPATWSTSATARPTTIRRARAVSSASMAASSRMAQPKLVWKKDGIRVKATSPILDKDRLYVCSDTADLYCLNATNGKQLWKIQYGKNAKGSPLLADGKIYVGSVDGDFQILQPGDKDCKILHTEHFEGAQVKGSAIAVNGKVYFMTTMDTYCLGKPGHTAKADPIPPPVKEPALGANPKAAHLQILPADVMVTPGESVAFTARAFDDKGRLIGEAKGEWTLAGQRLPEGLPPPPAPPPGTQPPPGPPALKGKLSETSGASTKLTIDAVPAIQAGRVVIKVGELTGEARVRVVPKVPFNADFSKVPEGRTPAGWVNAQGKFAVAKEGDKMVLKKTANNGNALVCRANTYIGAPNLTDYTIAADVMGHKVGDDMPDIGIIANRYRLELVGNTQLLRLTSWDALPRVDKTIAYPWQPKTWYSLKLQRRCQGRQGDDSRQGVGTRQGRAERVDGGVRGSDAKQGRRTAPVWLCVRHS